MTTLRRFRTDDLFVFNNVNMDQFTETFGNSFYMDYLARWPEYCSTAEAPRCPVAGSPKRPSTRSKSKEKRTKAPLIPGYVFGKVEGIDASYPYHGHVTAVTVAPLHRRLGLASALMKLLLDVTDRIHHAYFVDLFVRGSNKLAVGMYTKLNYVVYRRVLNYYSPGVLDAEDALDMRCACSRDVQKTTLFTEKNIITPHELVFA